MVSALQNYFDPKHCFGRKFLVAKFWFHYLKYALSNWFLILVPLAGFHKVMEGIEKAIEIGYNPVKVMYLPQNI